MLSGVRLSSSKRARHGGAFGSGRVPDAGRGGGRRAGPARRRLPHPAGVDRRPTSARRAPGPRLHHGGGGGRHRRGGGGGGGGGARAAVSRGRPRGGGG